MGASNCRSCCLETGQVKRTCCDVQEENMVGTPRLPAGFSYYDTTTKENQSSILDQRSADWKKASSFSKEKTIVRHMLAASTPDRPSSDHSNTSASDSVRPKSDCRRQSGSGPCSNGPWKQLIPTPLPGWTPEDQQILLETLSDYPRAGRDHAQLELALVKAAKRMPHRTSEDCHRCFKHIQESRIAIFRK